MVEREDVRAAVEARRELGEELEPQVIDSFLERIEQRLDKQARSQVPVKREGREGSFVLALASLVGAIPITAIAATHGGIVAMIVVWIGIVLLNAVYNR
jgi:anti-sigma factor RsiW